MATTSLAAATVSSSSVSPIMDSSPLIPACSIFTSLATVMTSTATMTMVTTSLAATASVAVSSSSVSPTAVTSTATTSMATTSLAAAGSKSSVYLATFGTSHIPPIGLQILLLGQAVYLVASGAPLIPPVSHQILHLGQADAANH